MRRTIYLVVADRKGRRLGLAAVKRLALEVAGELGPRALDRYQGDYVAGGTRFQPILDGYELHDAIPVVKVRADDAVRDLAVRAIARRARIVLVAGHDRQLIRV